VEFCNDSIIEFLYVTPKVSEKKRCLRSQLILSHYDIECGELIIRQIPIRCTDCWRRQLLDVKSIFR